MATIGMRGSLVRPLVTALRRALVESTGFTPLSLFAKGEQGVWYDPSDLTTLFQDSAGTVPVVASGDPVGLMLDKSGNGNHASQSVSASRPTYMTDGVLHWLKPDGIDDSMNSEQLPAGIPQPTSVSVAFDDQNPLGVALHIYDSMATSNRQTLISIETDRWWPYAGGGVASSLQRSQSPTILDILFNGAASNISQNGGGYLTGNYGSKAFDSVKLFSRYSNQQYLEGKFFGGVWVAGESLIEENRVALREYMSSKSGVIL